MAVKKNLNKRMVELERENENRRFFWKMYSAGASEIKDDIAKAGNVYESKGTMENPFRL
jgi:hypothetical protein